MTGNWGTIVVAAVVVVFVAASKLVAIRVRSRYRRTRDDRLAELAAIDGWRVVDAAAYRFFTSGPPPRAWTLVQQLRLDARSPVSVGCWLFATAGNAAGVLARVPSLYSLGLAAVAILLLVLPHAIRQRRRARVVALRAERVEGPAMFDKGYAFAAAATPALPDARGLKITVPWTAARALVDRRGSVELLVLVDGKAGQAIALR